MRQISFFVCLSLLLSLFYVTTAVAHSELLTTFPTQGAALTQSPAELRLQFSEPIGTGSALILFTQDFQQIPISVAIDQTRPSDLVAPVTTPLTAGTYTVQWLVISQDQHQLSGSYSFQIIGEEEMEILAEGTAINLPGWFAWMMVIIALSTPAIVWNWARNSR